ncbi:MAG: TrkA family potassium uptake protein [Ardenticatenales bacterium]|nr:TrkA family potassium uptake protein [Ardenticatenales bacterium]
MTDRARSSGRQGRKRHQEFVVVGLGRFGTSLARALIEFGHSVLALDSDTNRVQQLANDLPHVIALDATNIDALREVGVGDFETGVSCIGTNFEANLLATVLMRQLGVKRVVAKARTRTQRLILLKVGADDVILPEHEAGLRLARRLSQIEFVDYLSLGGDTGVVELRVPARYIGKSLAEAAIRQNYGLTVVAIHRDGSLIASPGPDVRMQAEDELLILGRISDAERFV